MKNKSNSRKRLLAVVALLGLGLSSWVVYAGTLSAPSLTAILTDLINDLGGGTPNVAEPGETIDLTATIDNPDALLTADNVRYQANIDPNTTLVPGSVNATPLAIDDAYTAIGNVGLNVPAPGVLANDIDPGGALPATAVTSLGSIATSQGGTVTMQNTGAFTYDPPAGFNGTDTFTYTIADSAGQPDVSTGDGVVSVSINVSDMIWFIQAGAAGGGDGTLSSPFNSLAQHNSNPDDSDGDCIFVAPGSYTGGINLQDQQTLIGAGSSASLAASCGITPPSGSKALPATGTTSPNLSNAGGDAISLASGNTIRGLDVGSTPSASDSIAGSGVGTLTISEVAINNPTGGGIDLTGPGALSITFDSILSNGSDNGISLNNTAGSFTVSGDGATTTFTQPVAGGTTVLARNGSGGTISSTGDGVRLVNATGVTLRQMNISTVGQDGIDLSSGSGSFTFSALDIGNTPGSCIQVSNLTGNCRIDNGTRLHDFNNTNTHALNIRNANTNMGLLAIENTIVENQANTNGAVAIDFDSTGSSQMAIDIDDCIFNNLFGDAILISPGQTPGSTGVTTANIRQCRFANAQSTGNGLGGVLFGSSNQADLIYTFDDNIVTDVGRGGAIAWVIAALAQNSGEMYGIKTNNSISDIQDRGAIAFRSVQSSVVGAGVIDGRINNNTITDVGRQCVFMDVFNDTPNFDAEVRNNQFGTPADPVGFADFLGGFSAVEVNYAYDAQLDLHIDENTVHANAIAETRLNFLGLISVWNDDLDPGTETAFARVNMTGNDVSNAASMPEFHADSFAGNTQLDAHIDDNNTAGGFPSPTIDIYEQFDEATQIHQLATLASRNNSATITDFSDSGDGAGEPALGSPPPLPTFAFPAP